MNKEYDCIVVGLGPTGLTLALQLLESDKKVLFIEASDSVGGCWKSRYIDDQYYTEHSPKVLFKYGNYNFNNLLKHIQINPKYKNISDGSFSEIFNLVRTHLTYIDVLKLLLFLVFYFIGFYDKNISIANWCKKYKLSDLATSMFYRLSIMYNNTPDKFKMSSFVKLTLDLKKFISIVQLQYPNEWLNKTEQILKAHANFDFKFNTQIEEIVTFDNSISHLLSTKGDQYKAKEYILCVPIRQLFNISKQSSKLIQHNWFSSFNEFEYFTEMSSYTGLGFQLHFDKKIKDIPMTCWSCFNDWSIIFLDKSKTLAIPSNDKNVKSVWSCVIIDLNTKSKFLKKSVNDCDTLEEIQNELIRQISEIYGETLKPYKITVSDNIKKENGVWSAWDSSFSNSMGTLHTKGKLNNLYSVGPHNLPDAVLIEVAIQSALRFCDIKKWKRVF